MKNLIISLLLRFRSPFVNSLSSLFILSIAINYSDRWAILRLFRARPWPSYLPVLLILFMVVWSSRISLCWIPRSLVRSASFVFIVIVWIYCLSFSLSIMVPSIIVMMVSCLISSFISWSICFSFISFNLIILRYTCLIFLALLLFRSRQYCQAHVVPNHESKLTHCLHIVLALLPDAHQPQVLSPIRASKVRVNQWEFKLSVPLPCWLNFFLYMLRYLS